VAALSPDGDLHASADYRKKVAATLAERVLAAALSRCRKSR
jgi:CO/xanthine dehydrogenase FAD-binding subunit